MKSKDDLNVPTDHSSALPLLELLLLLELLELLELLVASELPPPPPQALSPMTPRKIRQMPRQFREGFLPGAAMDDKTVKRGIVRIAGFHGVLLCEPSGLVLAIL